MDLLSLVGGRGLAGADRPNGLIGDNELVAVGGGNVLKTDVHLALDDFIELSGFALFERFADADDSCKTGGDDGARTLIDGLVGLAEVLTALGVSDDDVLSAGIEKHSGGNFARIGALLFPMGVLGSDTDVSTLSGGDGGGNVDSGRAARDFDVGIGLGGLGYSLDESSGLGGLNVHLPVTCDDFLTHDFINLSFLVKIKAIQICGA